MSKHFRPWNIDQTLLLPPNVRDFVPKDHVSRFTVGLVRESHPKPFRFQARSMWRRTFFSTQSLIKLKHSLECPTAK